jgi:hypothetical protein
LEILQLNQNTKKERITEIYNNILISMVAAGPAIIVPYYGLVWKSRNQLGLNRPTFNLNNSIFGGIKAAPTIIGIIGTQMILTNGINNGLTMLGLDGLQSKVCSLLSVSILSIYPLALFNGQTMGVNWKESLRSISLKQGASIVARESTFLGTEWLAETIHEHLKTYMGDSKQTEYGSTAIAGGMASLLGHPFDTALTRDQQRQANKLPSAKIIDVPKGNFSMAGAIPKSVAIAIFYYAYKLSNDSLQISEGRSE